MLNLQECQLNGVEKMLKSTKQSDPWRFLIYDEFCRDILAPLLKVGMIRNYGITLNIMIDSKKENVSEVPAVYFVEPTEENICMIINDIQNRSYANFYINFSSHVPQRLLKILAEGAVKAQAAALVSEVADRHINFVCFSPSEFSLHLKNSFFNLHANFEDAVIQNFLSKIVEGLFSVFVTLGVVPIIRCSSNASSPAQTVATLLEARFKDFYASNSTAATQIFGGSSSNFHRTLLVLLDREIDMSVMLNHTWTYQPLVDDLFGLKLNRVIIPVDKPDANGTSPPEAKTYELNTDDDFWAKYGAIGFPEAASVISDFVNEYNKKIESLRKQNEETNPSDLMSYINAVPEMAEKKRQMDMHTNIATAIVNEIKARELDRYYEVEEGIRNNSDKTNYTQIENLITKSSGGTATDKIRALLSLYLLKPNFPTASLNSLKEKLANAGGGLEPFDYLDLMQSYKNAAYEMSTMNVGGSGANISQQLGELGNKFFDKGRGLLQGVRNLLPTKRDFIINTYVENLLENTSHSLTEDFLYLDPRAAQIGVEGLRQRGGFKTAVVFVVGGGNYVESLALKELAQKTQKNILYGSTDFFSPIDFLDELTMLGRSVKEAK